MLKYNIEIIKDNYTYVDKTALIYQLITTGKYYFLARPRRFGKSLLVSTLASIFAGNRELFKGLAIDELEYEWKKHPVVKISLADIDCTSPESFREEIKRYLQEIGTEFELEIAQELSPGQMLQSLIKKLAKKAPVALLIDEYDYPILKHVHDVQMAEKMREVLSNFYGVLKGLDEHLKFVFLTGVSRFSKTSIFSGLNHLQDLTLSTEAAILVGLTEDEIRTHFSDYLQIAAKKFGVCQDGVVDKMREWYNGYCFDKEMTNKNVYNPFSVLQFFSQLDFSNYWFATGTPTFLINLIKSRDYPVLEFENIQATESELSNFDVDNISLVTLLFQTGYLTIKNYDKESTNYLLYYPNKETKDSLFEYIFASISPLQGSHLRDFTATLLKSFANHNFEQLKQDITHIFTNVLLHFSRCTKKTWCIKK
jgi:hypothetical protein